MSGWIKDFRKEIESDIWLMPPMYHRVWQWIKYSVNHSAAKIPNKDGTFTELLPGQRATSYRQIAKGVGYYEGRKWKEPNVKTIKSILDWMIKQKMITVKGNTLGTIITVENWALYQSESEQGNTKRITMETREKHHLDTNKNDKEELKNEKNNNSRFTPPTLGEVKEYCKERGNDVDANKWLNFYESKGWMVGKNKMKNWKAAVRTWETKKIENNSKVRGGNKGVITEDDF